jgi:hypothetical protein
MSNWKEPVSLIRKRLQMTMIFSSQGNAVSNYDLDLLNRAQMWLSQFRPWDFLTKNIQIVLSDSAFTLPDNCNAILDIYSVDGSGIPVIHYTKDNVDPTQSYSIEATFDKSTGQTWKVSFVRGIEIGSELRLKYTCNLDDFVGTDENGVEIVEYSFFPPNLLLRCAQKMHIEDKGITGDSQQLALNAFEAELRKYEANSQYNNQAMDLTIKNHYGQPLKISGHSLSGTKNKVTYSPFSRSTHSRLN